MTKFMGLVVALAATMGVTLATPASSEAGGFRRCRSYYVESCCNGCPVVDCCPTNCGCYTQTVPCYSNTWSAAVVPGYSSGHYWTAPGYTSGYYRVGNVIINGRRWGDIGSRYSHGDLIRW